MTEPGGVEQRLTSIESRLDSVESRLKTVANDAAAVRYLAAAHLRDLADVGVRVDANRRAINALGEQTADRFDRLENGMQAGFTQMRGKFDQVATGHDQIVGLPTRIISDQDER